MSDIGAQDVMKLRKETGAGMMDAKRALQEAGGDFDDAKDLLRVKGLADAKKRAGRATTQGSIGHYLHYQTERPVVGCLVELLCETDFVAKSEEFQGTAKDLAMHLAARRPGWVRREDVPGEVIAKEQQLFQAQAEEEGKPSEVAEKIIAGRLEAYLKDNVLYEQTFINPEKFLGTVQEMLDQLTLRLGENVSVGKIARISVGEE